MYLGLAISIVIFREIKIPLSFSGSQNTTTVRMFLNAQCMSWFLSTSLKIVEDVFLIRFSRLLLLLIVLYKPSQLCQDVLPPVVAAIVTHSKASESFFTSKSLHVYDSVLGEFLPRKTTLYNLYNSLRCCRCIDMLQWTWELFFLYGMQ